MVVSAIENDGLTIWDHLTVKNDDGGLITHGKWWKMVVLTRGKRRKMVD